MTTSITRPATGTTAARKHGNEIHTETFASAGTIATAVTEYLIAHPPAGGLTIEQIKADLEILDAIAKRHTAGSDNQDLSNLQPKESGKGLSSNDFTTDYKNKLDATAWGKYF
jgi:hypothetical protein